MIANMLVLLFALALILLPELRSLASLRWTFACLFFLVMAAESFMAFRTGHLSVPLTALHKRRPQVSAVKFLAATCGTVALVLVM